MAEIEVNLELAKNHSLSEEEWKIINELLGRKPTYEELGIFSAMWSEHCSYKSSKIHLKKLPTKASWVLQGPGENAGIIDIGEALSGGSYWCRWYFKRCFYYGCKASCKP